jgi:hypothetical protein
MEIEATSVAGVCLIKPTVHGDARGFFLETWHANRYAEAGIDLPFVQDNHSRSTQGILRGLHLQTEKPQGKLVRVTSGAVFDVVVDCRASLPDLWPMAWRHADRGGTGTAVGAPGLRPRFSGSDAFSRLYLQVHRLLSSAK